MDSMTRSFHLACSAAASLVTMTIITWVAASGCSPERDAKLHSQGQAPAGAAPNGQATEQKSSEVNTQVDGIVWAGLQGTPPRYIDQGEDEGLGYSEVETKDVRAALVDAGFAVTREYYTSTRLAYEFTNRHPVCFYPVEWMPATEKFAENPERILSLPLNFSGEETRHIIFRKGEAHRFDKHIDAKGNLNLDSLIRDKSLRAVFPNNRFSRNHDKPTSEFAGTSCRLAEPSMGRCSC